MVLAFLLPPLLGFLINAFRFQAPDRKTSGLLASFACFLSFLSVVFYIFIFGFDERVFSIRPWLQVGDLDLSFSFVADPLSLLFSLLITGVGFLIHIYSLSYMSEDKGLTRYFAYLNLFVFMMLILVLADNLLLLFVGWEGVGLCSYLLIGFWFDDFKKAKAGMMAFVANRIGDAGFLLGLFLIFFHFGTLRFSELNALFDFQNAGVNFFHPGLWAGFFLFLGATGKSAQLPLYFWLPEAMAGPTPVSALIHAATMVTAGVYMVVRLSAFYSSFPDLLFLMSWVGALTAFGSALVAARQWDFKKILAYSTISQLSYLFMALGVKAFSASIFHLFTHGFFKALLFLCAGSVIHALKGQQDIRFMGGLRESMPKTFFTYLIGALALMALPPFSGFFSKEEILWSLFSSGHRGLFVVAFFTGLITVFYMTRLSVLVFFGKKRSEVPAHESPSMMTIPLMILCFFAFFGGFLGIPHIFSDFLPGHPDHFLHELLKDFSPASFKGSALAEFLIMILSTLSGLLVTGLTGFYYLKSKKKDSPRFRVSFLEQAFFVPAFLESYIQPSFKNLSTALFQGLDEGFFSKGILLLNAQVFKLKNQFSILQNGNLQSYVLYFVIGLSGLIILIFVR